MKSRSLALASYKHLEAQYHITKMTHSELNTWVVNGLSHKLSLPTSLRVQTNFADGSSKLLLPYPAGVAERARQVSAL